MAGSSSGGHNLGGTLWAVVHSDDTGDSISGHILEGALGRVESRCGDEASGIGSNA